MNHLERFLAQRDKIVQCLQNCSIPTILFNKDNIPKNLPCAIVILDTEDGIKPTSRQFTSTDIAWTVYLIVNAQNVDDPELDLYKIKEKYRVANQNLANLEITNI
jgi:hypothetical protein